jgi:hypothetical protein
MTKAATTTRINLKSVWLIRESHWNENHEVFTILPPGKISIFDTRRDHAVEAADMEDIRQTRKTHYATPAHST